ncbi:MAG: FAD-binding oxidoreductase [Dehalococcoidia bacterium]
MSRTRGLERAIASIPRNRKIIHPTGTASYTVDGRSPEAVVFPNTVEELSTLLSAAEGDGKAVVPWGAGTQMGLGNLAGRVGLVVGMSRLNRILEYEPADLTVIVEGGISLELLQSELAHNGQFLPLDPPCADDATVGGILASNASGPRRAYFGTARDRLIGIKVVHPNGDVTKGGGRVVKNVSGYDMNKLYTGSLGTLGVIVEAAFKIAPLFKEERTLLLSCPSLDAATRLALDIPKCGVQSLALELLDPRAAAVLSSQTGGRPALDGYTLAAELGGTPAAVDRQEKEVRALCERASVEVDAISEKENAASIWNAIRDFGRGEGNPATMIVKNTCLPTGVVSLIEEILSVGQNEGITRAVLSNITSGVTYSYWWALDGSIGALKGVVDQLRTLARKFSGHAVVEVCPIELKEKIDVWGIEGSETYLMRRIKEQFDPKGTLNPGRFVDGI